MKKRLYTDEEKIRILKEGRGEITVPELCAKYNIAKDTYYAWRKKFGTMEVDEARRLRALEEENRRQARIIADQAVKIQILEEVNSKKW